MKGFYSTNKNEIMADSDNNFNQLDSLKSSFANSKPFSLPDNYFDNLNQKIVQATAQSMTEGQAPKPTIWLRLRPIVYMAAMFASLFMIIKFVIGNAGSNKSEAEYASNQSNDIELLDDYMASRVDEYSIYESYKEYSDTDALIHDASFVE